MKKKALRIQSTVIAFILVFAAFCVPALAGNTLTELVGERNRQQLETQMSDADALYSVTLPEEYIDSDNENIINKATEITAECETDLEKVSAVHDWVAANIYYDLDFYYGRTTITPLKASDVLEYRYSVCQGYAQLTAALLRALGIPAKLVTGYALIGNNVWTQEYVTGALKNEENHAWNEAYADGRWVVLDATWDSPNTLENGIANNGGEIYRTFFDVTPEELATDHKIVAIDDNHTFISRTYGFIFTTQSKKIVVTGLYDDALTTLVIPSYISGYAVTGIGSYAFWGKTSLTRVVIPETVTFIGSLSFAGCSSLHEITLPGKITSVGTYAFGFDIVTYDPPHYSLRPMGDFKIYCSAGTAAFSYASDYNIKRQLVDEYKTRDGDTETTVTALTAGDAPPVFTLTELLPESFAAFAEGYVGMAVRAYDLSVTVCGDKLPDSTVTTEMPLPSDALSGTVKVYAVVNGNTVELQQLPEADRMLTFKSEGVERFYLVYKSFVAGDLDLDGAVTTSDARIVLRAAASLETLTPAQLEAAEDDGVPGISTTDARILLRVAAHLQTL